MAERAEEEPQMGRRRGGGSAPGMLLPGGTQVTAPAPARQPRSCAPGPAGHSSLPPVGTRVWHFPSSTQICSWPAAKIPLCPLGLRPLRSFHSEPTALASSLPGLVSWGWGTKSASHTLGLCSPRGILSPDALLTLQWGWDASHGPRLLLKPDSFGMQRSRGRGRQWHRFSHAHLQPSVPP